jgi:hypothetical protein
VHEVLFAVDVFLLEKIIIYVETAKKDRSINEQIGLSSSTSNPQNRVFLSNGEKWEN